MFLLGVIIVVAAVVGATVAAVAAAEAAEGDRPPDEGGVFETLLSVALGVLVGLVVGFVVGALFALTLGLLVAAGAAAALVPAVILGALVGAFAGGLAAWNKEIVIGVTRALWGSLFEQNATRPTPQWRPRFHFTPPSGWMNDPCGLIRLGGEYHLFFQHVRTPQNTIYFPFMRKYKEVVWGHVTSADLVRWPQELLSPALTRDRLGTPFTGSAVVPQPDSTLLDGETSVFPNEDGDVMVLVFTHSDTQLVFLPKQRQSLAFASSPEGFSLFSRNPVLERFWNISFRDPKVFRFQPVRGEAKWIMALAAGREVLFYGSDNLEQWSGLGADNAVTNHLAYEQGSAFVECPELLEVPVVSGDATGETRFVLIFSRGAVPGTDPTAVEYLVGEFDGVNFQPLPEQSERRLVDFGPDLYATQSWFHHGAQPERPVIAGWMNNWFYAERLPTNPWRGQLSIVRELSLRQTEEGFDLLQAPVTQLDSLWDVQESVTGQAVPSEPTTLRAADGNLSFEEGEALSLDAGEIIADITVNDATVVRLAVRVGGTEQTTISWVRDAGTIVLDRTASGAVAFHDGFAGLWGGPLAMTNGRLRLRVLVDRSSIEVFGGVGETVLSALIFPAAASDEVQLSATTDGPTVPVANIVVNRLR